MGKKRFFNFKNLFFVSFLAVAGIFSAAAIIKDKQVEETPVVERADASTTANYLYFLSNSSWDADNSWTAAYFYGGSQTPSEKWVAMQRVPGSTYMNYLSTTETSTKGYANVIFVRMQSGKTIDDKWDGRKDGWQTADLTLSNSKNCYVFGSSSWTNETIDNTYFRGSMNSWGATDSTKFSTVSEVSGFSITLTKSIALSKNDEFKVANSSYSWELQGNSTDSNGSTLGAKAGSSRLSTDSGNVKVNTAGYYVFNITRYVGGTWTANSVSYYPASVTIQYKDKGGSAYSGSTTGLPTSHTNGSTTNLVSPSNKTGYTFGGWYDNSACTGSAVTSISSSTLLSSTKTFYAKWNANQYTITYKDQGNVNYSGSNLASLPTTHTYGSATVLVDGVKSNYNFAGWYTDQDCTGTAITSLSATGYTDNIILYAKWAQDVYTVNYIAGSGVTGSPSKTSETVAVGNSFTTATRGTMAKTGYTFTGWHGDDGNDYSAGTSYSSLAKDATLNLTSTWSKDTFTITYNNNGGSGTMSSTTFTYDTAGSIRTNSFTKHGYEFRGWATSSSGAVVYTNSQSLDVSQVNALFSSGNRILYAVWGEYSDFWVSFDGGTNKTRLNTVSSETPPSDCLYQLNTADTLTVWASQTISFYRGATAQTASIVSSSNIEADSAGDILSITPTDNKWQINNYATGQTLYFKVRKSGQSSLYSFYLSGKEDRSSQTCGVTSGTTFYVEDMLKKNGSSTNYAQDGCNIGVYFYNPVGEGVNVNAWGVGFATLVKSSDGVDRYSITVPYFQGVSMKWGSVIVCRFSSSTTTSQIDFDHNIDNNGAKLNSFNSDVENMIQITTWTGSGDAEYPSKCNSTMLTDGGLQSGTGVYVDTSGLNYGDWVINGSRHLYVYFFSVVDGSGGESAWSAAMTAVPGKNNYYECEVPKYNGQSVEWAKIIVVNNTSAAFVQGQNKYQTQDMWYSAAIRDHQLITFTGSSTGELKVEASNSSAYTDTDRANYWGSRFIGPSGVICYEGDPRPYTSAWTAMRSEYNPMSSVAKNLVKTATASESGTDLQKAVARYDYIIHKYGTDTYVDYASRTDKANGGAYSYGAVTTYKPFELIMGSSEDNLSVIIIVIVSSVSLLSITALSVLLVKKRKTKQD